MEDNQAETGYMLDNLGRPISPSEINWAAINQQVLSPQQGRRLIELASEDAAHPLEKELAAERDKVRTLTAENRRLKQQRKELRAEIERLKSKTGEKQ
jgi:predicted RNase H-like nuclease (RuvC/YqgF family)